MKNHRLPAFCFLRRSTGLEWAASAMSGQMKAPELMVPGFSFWWVGLRLLIFSAPVAAGLQKSERGPCSSSAVSAASSASLAQQYRTRTGMSLLCPGKTKTQGLWPQAFVLVGRVALADFSCARRRGLAKIRALPLLQLGCICRRQRLACAAVQDPNGHVSAMPRQNKNPGPVASGFRFGGSGCAC